MAPIPWDYTPAQRQALRDAELRDAIARFDLQARRERLAAAVAKAEQHRQGRSTTIPAGTTAYRVDVSETPFPDRLDDQAARLAAAQTSREAARATQTAGADLSATQRSQRDQVAAYLIESRGLRRVVVRDSVGRLREDWIPDTNGATPEA